MLYFLYPNMKKKLRDIRLRQNVTTEKKLVCTKT